MSLELDHTKMLSVADYDRVSESADRSYAASKKSKIAPENPYPKDTEANEIWDVRMQDLSMMYGDLDGNPPINDDFVVLGKATTVSVVAEHEDGSVTYSIPSPKEI